MPFITQGKTNWRYIFIVVILAAIVGGGILWFLQQQIPSYQPLEIKIPEKIKDETADWKTYKNEEYGVEIKYPKNLTAKDWAFKAPNWDLLVYIGENKDIGNGVLSIGIVKGVNAPEQKSFLQSEGQIKDLENVLIGENNYSAKRFSYKGPVPESIEEADSVDYFIERSGYLYQINWNRKLLPEKTFNQILSTFRLTEIKQKADKCQEIQSLEEQNRCYFNLALDTKDADYCRKLLLLYSSVSSQDCLRCLAALNNNLGLCPEYKDCPKDVFLQNTELCPDIKIDTITMCRDCYLDGLTGASCKLEKSKIDKKEKCIRDIAIETGDFELCWRIDEEYCQKEVAIKLNKPEMCRRLVDSYKSNSCLTELAINNKDIKLCDNGIHCILEVAHSSDDSSLCEEVSEDEPREACYAYFGIKMGKEGSCESCEKIPNAISKRYCMLEVTAITEDYKFCEGLDIDIEDFFKKYTDEEFGFSFYYPYYSKDDEIEFPEDEIEFPEDEIEFPEDEIEKIQIEKGGYLFSEYMSAGGDGLEWTSYIFYDDEGKCVNYFMDYFDCFMGSGDCADSREIVGKEEENPGETKMPPIGHYVKGPSFYTMSGLSVFSREMRWGAHYNIVCLYPDKFLKIDMDQAGAPFSSIDTFTKTIIRTDQIVEDKKIKKTLIEEFIASKVLSFEIFYFLDF